MSIERRRNGPLPFLWNESSVPAWVFLLTPVLHASYWLPSARHLTAPLKSWWKRVSVMPTPMPLFVRSPLLSVSM